MKKTLITLLALAGVAGAYDNELGVPLGSGDPFCAGDFSFNFDVTAGLLSATNTNDVLAFYYGTFSGGNYYTNAFVLNYNSTTSAITLSVGDGAISEAWDTTNKIPVIKDATTFTSLRGATFTTTLTEGETYTVMNIGAAGEQKVQLWQEGTLLETVTYNGNMNGGDEDTVLGSVANASYNVVAVPEPTTATLSLLALAGLAARRRRK